MASSDAGGFLYSSDTSDTGTAADSDDGEEDRPYVRYSGLPFAQLRTVTQTRSQFLTESLLFLGAIYLVSILGFVALGQPLWGIGFAFFFTALWGIRWAMGRGEVEDAD